MECVCVCLCVCVCVCATLRVYVCVRTCPTVTKWFDRPCHMVDKWWMGARQHTIKPVNLLGNVSSHLPPDVWPVNTQTNRGSRLKHTHINLPHLHFTLTTFSLPAPQAKHGRLTLPPPPTRGTSRQGYMIILAWQQATKKGCVDCKEFRATVLRIGS